MASDTEPSANASTSSHRLPTISASEALLSLPTLDCISFGLSALDAVQRPQASGNEHSDARAGLRRGRVTEIHGPPGVGKTTLGLQAAANALAGGGHVMWIDAASSFVGQRLKDMLSAIGKEPSPTSAVSPANGPATPLDRILHFVTPTLSHLIALLAHWSESSLPQDTVLIVIDNLSVLLDIAYPRKTQRTAFSGRGDYARFDGGARQRASAEMGIKLAKLATQYHVAVLVTSKVVTKIRGESQAVLRSALAGDDWEDAVDTRIALFRDWASGPEPRGWQVARMAIVVKVAGTSSHSRWAAANGIAFAISPAGIAELSKVTATASSPTKAKSTRGKKRAFSDVADSDAESSDSEFSWFEDDAELSAEGLINSASLTSPTSRPLAHLDQQQESC